MWKSTWGRTKGRALYLIQNRSRTMPPWLSKGSNTKISSWRRWASIARQKKQLTDGGNTTALMAALFTTPPSFDNRNGLNSKQALQSTDSWQLASGGMRSFAPGLIDNPYALASLMADKNKNSSVLTSAKLSYGNAYNDSFTAELEGSYQGVKQDRSNRLPSLSALGETASSYLRKTQSGQLQFRAAYTLETSRDAHFSPEAEIRFNPARWTRDWKWFLPEADFFVIGGHSQKEATLVYQDYAVTSTHLPAADFRKYNEYQIITAGSDIRPEVQYHYGAGLSFRIDRNFPARINIDYFNITTDRFILPMSAEQGGFVLLNAGKLRNRGWNAAALDYLGMSQTSADQRNTKAFVFDGVDHAGQANDRPVDFYDPSKSLSDNRWVRYGMTGVGEAYIEDASWVKLSSVSVSYNLYINRQVRNIVLGLSAYNLLTITGYKGVDPSSSLYGNASGNGLDLFNLPGSRSFLFSIKMNLSN